MAGEDERGNWNRELLLVSGLGRCGSSLMMQMLDAGGFPICGDIRGPAYEHPSNANPGLPLPELRGALKWLDPQRIRPPAPAASLLLVRDHPQQAQSHLKFLAAVGVDVTGCDLRAHVRSFWQDEKRAGRLLKALGPVHIVRFEYLIESPKWTLQGVADFLGFPLDIDAAVAVKRPRSTGARCLPYLLEVGLLEPWP